MATQFIAPREVIEVKEQFPDENILILDTENTNKAKGSDTYFIPVLIKRLVGKPTRCSLKITKQIIASNAKIGFGVKPKDAKDVRVTFRKLEAKDLEDTDYPEENHTALLKFNDDLIKAKEILANEYAALVESDVLEYEGDKFEVGSCRTVHNFRQTTRKASKEEIAADKKLPKEDRQVSKDKKLPLPMTLYRTKLSADIKNGQKIGQYTKKGHRYIVFDARKAKKNGMKPVVAKVRKNGKLVDLTTDSARNFVTYMSLVGGVENYECVCLSSFGISFIVKFRDLHVWPHKQMKTQTLDEEDFDGMAMMGTSGYDSDAEIEEPESKSGDESDDFDEGPEVIATKKSKKSKKSKKKPEPKSDSESGEEFMDDEPESNAEESEAEESEADDDAEASDDEDYEPPKMKNRTKKSKLKSSRK